VLKSSVVLPPFGLSELAPTNVDVWALMGAPFSSFPIPQLTKVANLGRPFSSLSSTQVGFFFGEFFFLNPHAHLGLIYLPTFRLPTYLTYLSTFRLPNYAPWPPPPYLPTYLPTQLPTYPLICLPTHQPTFLRTYTLNLHQGDDDARQ
jgi:hypothetical protein